MPARHRFRSSGVAPRFCARHLAKNPPPVLFPPRPALASPLLSSALLLASAAWPHALLQSSAGPANAPTPAGPLPWPGPRPGRSLPGSTAPPPLARTRSPSVLLPLSSPFPAPVCPAGDTLPVSLSGCTPGLSFVRRTLNCTPQATQLGVSHML